MTKEQVAFIQIEMTTGIIKCWMEILMKCTKIQFHFEFKVSNKTVWYTV